MIKDGRFRTFISRNRGTFYLGFFALMISSIGDLFAGATLGFMTDTLELLPGLMVLIPPAIGMRGNIFGALGSRLGTSMHVGTFEMSFRKGGTIRNNMESSLALTLVMSVLMGVMAKLVSELFGFSSIPLEQFIFISVFGGVLAGLMLLAITIFIARLGYYRGWDIDNVSAPIITAAGDVLTLPMLFVAALFVLWGSDISYWTVEIFAVISLLVASVVAIANYRRKAGEARRIFVHSMPALIICTIMDIGAGLTIEHQLESIVLVPAIFVMIPPFLEDANSLGGILTSRLSSMLHMGTLEPRRFPGTEALENFAIIYIFALYVFTLVGVSTYVVAWLIGLSPPPLTELVALSLLAGLITVSILNLISYYVATVAFRFSLDPDDHSIPFTSSSIDFIGAAALMGCILLLGIA
ncbi:MAG: magnesium transporter [Methanomassiliicoccales archaeon]|nr:MAG: magnesium transporter [Methanomassiliicoccales archaeon]